MTQPSPDGITTLLVGGVILGVGYLVKYRRWTGLISEATAIVSPTDETPPLVASLVGNVTLVVGGFVVVLGAFEILGLASQIPEWVVLLLLVGAVVLLAPRMDVVLD